MITNILAKQSICCSNNEHSQQSRLTFAFYASMIQQNCDSEEILLNEVILGSLACQTPLLTLKKTLWHRKFFLCLVFSVLFAIDTGKGDLSLPANSLNN